MTTITRRSRPPRRISRTRHRPRRRDRHIRIANRRLRLSRRIRRARTRRRPRRLDRLDMLRRLPAEVLAALTEILAIRVLTATTWADPHETPGRKVTHHTVPVKERGIAWDPSR